MRRPDRLQGGCAFAGAALLLCVVLAGAGAGAGASVLAMPQARAVTASMLAAPGMPSVSGGMPCALCHLAPTPSPSAFTGKGKASEPLGRWVHAEPIPAATRFVTSVSRCERVAIRVAFCRWSE